MKPNKRNHLWSNRFHFLLWHISIILSHIYVWDEKYIFRAVIHTQVDFRMVSFYLLSYCKLINLVSVIQTSGGIFYFLTSALNFPSAKLMEWFEGQKVTTATFQVPTFWLNFPAVSSVWKFYSCILLFV